MGNLRRLCALLVAFGTLHIDGAGAQETGEKHKANVVENTPVAKAEVNGVAVQDFGDLGKDQDEVETALRRQDGKVKLGARALWAVIRGNGSIYSFAGTRDGGDNKSETGDLVANNFVYSLTATTPNPDPNEYTHRADFLLNVIPEIAIEVSLHGSGPRIATREHKVSVRMNIEAQASTDRNAFNTGFLANRSRKIEIEAVVRLAKPGDPPAHKIGPLFHNVTVKIDDVAQPEADAHFLGDEGEAGGKVFFSEQLRSAMRVTLDAKERYFLSLARMTVKTLVNVKVVTKQPGFPGDVVTCHANLVVEDAQVYDVDERIGPNVGESTKRAFRFKVVPQGPKK